MHGHRNVSPRRRDRERGAGLVEYALLLSLIAAVVFGAVSYFGAESGAGYKQSATCFEAAYNGDPIPAECK